MHFKTPTLSTLLNTSGKNNQVFIHTPEPSKQFYVLTEAADQNSSCTAHIKIWNGLWQHFHQYWFQLDSAFCPQIWQMSWCQQDCCCSRESWCSNLNGAGWHLLLQAACWRVLQLYMWFAACTELQHGNRQMENTVVDVLFLTYLFPNRDCIYQDNTCVLHPIVKNFIK